MLFNNALRTYFALSIRFNQRQIEKGKGKNKNSNY